MQNKSEFIILVEYTYFSFFFQGPHLCSSHLYIQICCKLSMSIKNQSITDTTPVFFILEEIITQCIQEKEFNF